MKRLRLFLCIFLLLLALTSCGGEGATPPGEGGTATQTELSGGSASANNPGSITESPTEAQQSPPYTVTVTCDLPDGVSFSGGDLLQTVMAASDFEPVELTVWSDYVYGGYEVNGVLFEGTTLTLPEEITGDTEIRVRLSYLTQELPVVSISTNGVEVTSKEEYVSMTFSLTGCEDEMWQVAGDIRVRGNSTSTFPKLPYRIRFAQKQSLFGLDKAKSWVLLADYLDPSTLHNYAALSLAASSDNFSFVPTPHKVNLYLNGAYAGVYTLCEQVQEQPGRLDLEMTITEDMTELSDYNFLICMNHNASEKAGAVRGETYFYLRNCDRYFELEYPTKEDFPTEAQFDSFMDQLTDYMEDVVNACMEESRSYLTRNVDMDSLIDLFIVDQIMGERDHHWKSVFMYYTGAAGESKLHFGPPWDYDFCMFTQWTAEPNEEFVIHNKINVAEAGVFFYPILYNSHFYDKAKERYRTHFADVLTDLIEDVERQANAMAESLSLNQDRWYEEKPTITEDNVEFFLEYLKARKSYLSREWRN